MPISICLPAGEIYASEQAPQMRALGDPGTTEQFKLPQYLYIYIVNYVSGDKNNNDNWEVCEIIKKSIDDETGSADQKKAAWEAQWTRMRNPGPYDTKGDDIYRFTTELVLLLESGSFDGRVYAIASAEDLSLLFESTIVVGTKLSTLLNLSFSFSPDGGDSGEKAAAKTAVKGSLQNIYSTPYNYTGNGSSYYGSFFATQNVPHLDLLLYHVAAKVDLMWNVNAELRNTVKLNYIAATNLYDESCLLFRPTENKIAGAAYSSGYTKEILNEKINDVPTPCPGTQWNGRAYFYVIPYRNNNSDTGKYPLQLRLCKGGDVPEDGSYYSKTVPTDVEGTWTSWIRGQITINTADYNYPPPTP